MKICNKCNEKKPLDQFYRSPISPDGRVYMCKACEKPLQRDYQLKIKFGLSLAEFEQMQIAQDYKCAICGKEKRLNVDHDHKTMKIRGLLCSTCNKGLGLFYDDKQLLLNSLKYLGG